MRRLLGILAFGASGILFSAASNARVQDWIRQVHARSRCEDLLLREGRVFTGRELPKAKLVSIRDLGDSSEPEDPRDPLHGPYRAPKPGTSAERMIQDESMPYGMLTWVFTPEPIARDGAAEIFDELWRRWRVRYANSGLRYSLAENPEKSYQIDLGQFEKPAHEYRTRAYELIFQGPQFQEPHRMEVELGFGSPFRIEHLVEVLNDMPDVLVYSIRRIITPPMGLKRFGVSATANARGLVRLYPSTNIFGHPHGADPHLYLKRTLVHEAGHTLAGKVWGTTEPGWIWNRAMKKDRMRVSEYGETNRSEDFAEEVRVFSGAFSSDEDVSPYLNLNRARLIEIMFFRDHPLNRDPETQKRLWDRVIWP